MSRFFKLLIVFSLPVLFGSKAKQAEEQSWIRINQLGYIPNGKKVAVWCSKQNKEINKFQLIDSATGTSVFTGTAGKAFGAYGPFKQSYRLNFSSFVKPGKYYLQAGGVHSPVFKIGGDVYKVASDFACGTCGSSVLVSIPF